jgi:hypothetical protein
VHGTDAGDDRFGAGGPGQFFDDRIDSAHMLTCLY